MDPRKQECFGLYLYGAGYFARDENTLSVVVGGQERTQAKHFCMVCPRMTSCEKAHNTRVRNDAPREVAEYDRVVREAARRGVSELLARVMLARRGADPFQTQAIENFNRGHADRGRIAGLIVHSDADPRRG